MNFTKLPGNLVEAFCIIKLCEKKLTSKGSPYLDLLLYDTVGEISAKLWDYDEEHHGTFSVDDFIKVRGTLSVYNGVEQLRIEKIRRVCEEDEIKIEDFVPSAEYSGQDMLAELFAVIETLKDPHLAEITASVLNEYKEKLLYWPAAYKLHHAIRGGLLYHTLTIVRLAESICKVYSFVDRDLLIAGAILHDIAKVEEFEITGTGLAAGYSTEGNLLGHIVKGVLNLEKLAEQLGTPRETLMLLQHMILSHHGQPEYGAAVFPMFIEAELLSQLDLMDARMYEMAKALETTEIGDFSPRQWALDNRRLYNHGRKKIKAKANLLEADPDSG